MSFRLNVTRTAQNDITRNAAWWAENHSLEEALNWYDSVYDQLNELLLFPQSHGFAAENELFSMELREFLVGGKNRTYRAVYTIVESAIHVLTIRRGAQGPIQPGEIQDF